MDSDPVVSTADLVDFFGVSDQTIANLTAKGVLARVGRGRYHLRASTRAYIGQLREQAAGRAPADAADEPDRPLDLARERALLARVQREGHAMRNAVLRGELISVEDAEAEIGAIIAASKAKLLGLPTRLAPSCIGLTDLVQAREVLTEGTHEALNELADTSVIVGAAAARGRSRIGVQDADDALDEDVAGAAEVDGQRLG